MEREWSARCANKVWNLLFIIFPNHEAYEYMKPYKRSRDGRGAYLALWSHYVGPNNVNLMAAELESQFQGLSYTQETRVGTLRSMSTSMLSFTTFQRTSNGVDIPE